MEKSHSAVHHISRSLIEITDVGFAARIQFSQAHEGEPVQWEDLAAEGLKYPLADNELWQDKIAKPEKITCPAYVVASYSNTLHTMGTFRAWRAIPDGKKWMRIHDGQEWPDFYTQEYIDDRKKFFDYYLKGINNGWEDTPIIRYSLHDFEGGNITGIPAKTFPPEGVKYEKLYLDGMTRTLIPSSKYDEPESINSQENAPANSKLDGKTSTANSQDKDFPVKYNSEGVVTLASFIYTVSE